MSRSLEREKEKSFNAGCGTAVGAIIILALACVFIFSVYQIGYHKGKVDYQAHIKKELLK